MSENVAGRRLAASGATRLRGPLQNGSGAGGVLPWSLAGTFPFGGPFTVGPFTAGAVAAGAAGAAAAGAGAARAAPVGAAGLALAPGAALPGFGTPPAAGAEGASPADTTGAGTGAGAGLAPSEHPANPLTATARADVATAHHRQRMRIEEDPPEGRFVRSAEACGENPDGLQHTPADGTGRQPAPRGRLPPVNTLAPKPQSIEVLSDWPSARPASWRSVSGSVSTARNFTEPSTIE
jgi:hypothetical protein